jgi:predicted metal-dependent phosphoesterase TrpH
MGLQGTDVLKVDLHLHTAEDPVDYILHDARQLIDRAAVLGFDALAITLHDKQLADPSVFAYARERRIVLLPGIERSIQGCHVVLVNFPQCAEEIRTFDELAVLKARTAGIVIAPHPFFPHRSSLGSCLAARPELFDAVEWSYFWTGGLNFNAPAARWAAAHGKPVVGNSDLHDIRQLGRTYSRVVAEPEPDAICHAIREGRVSLQTSPVPKTELARVLLGMASQDIKQAARSFRSRGQTPGLRRMGQAPVPGSTNLLIPSPDVRKPR